jgi:N-acetylneuraminic acid mutarotase
MRIGPRILAVLLLASCGGGGGGGGAGGAGPNGAGTSSYMTGGTVTGLRSGASVVLQETDNPNKTINGNGPFSFAEPLASGTQYLVTVLTQPSGQKCSVVNASGVIGSAAVTDLDVVCLAHAWTWMGGADTSSAFGIYGAKGAAAAANVPGARENASYWTDAFGYLWLFGGNGVGRAGSPGALNDLWLYCPCSGAWAWTWMGGANTTDAAGVYGTQGLAAAGNAPGARQGASGWTDSYGNLWLFGGIGFDAAGAQGTLGDLWKFTPSLGTWSWVAGPDSTNASGIYTVPGAPGARSAAASWTDAAGNLWLFGGNGYAATGAPAELNDLWTYSTSNGSWTWLSGASTTNAAGIYGTLGVASTSGAPGARQGASAWVDPSGNLWLFGGLGYDAAGTLGVLNDLWVYQMPTQNTAGMWMWVGGSSLADAPGSYGTPGLASAGNMPGARQGANAWIDASGTLSLMGGFGLGSAAGTQGTLNDLWQYVPSAGTWTWINGASTVNATGSYGLEGIISASNEPGARSAGATWIDPSGNLWLVGGSGYGSAGSGILNDLWEYTP